VVKLYIGIGIFLIISWVLMWFAATGMMKALDQGEESKLAKMFLPKDYMRNLEMAERQAQRKRRQAERERKARDEEENNVPEESTENTTTEKEEE